MRRYFGAERTDDFVHQLCSRIGSRLGNVQALILVEGGGQSAGSTPSPPL